MQSPAPDDDGRPTCSGISPIHGRRDDQHSIRGDLRDPGSRESVDQRQECLYSLAYCVLHKRTEDAAHSWKLCKMTLDGGVVGRVVQSARPGEAGVRGLVTPGTVDSPSQETF